MEHVFGYLRLPTDTDFTMTSGCQSANRAKGHSMTQPLAGKSGDTIDPRIIRLIETSKQVFRKKGYHATTMNDIAKALGISKRSLYLLVNSKIDLLRTLLTHSESCQNFPVRQPQWTTKDALVANLLYSARFLMSAEQVLLLRLIMEEHAHSSMMIKTLYQKHLQRARSTLEKCLREIDVCHCACPADIREMSSLVFGSAIGEFYFNVLVGARQLPSCRILKRQIEFAVDMFLMGCEIYSQTNVLPKD
jgi:TetR/AcrR family transcriptional regulator, mexJK operon transcriptional repressor